MRPQPGGGLTYATAELQSMHGVIRSAWTQENGRFDWYITVPPNTTAAIYVPARDPSQVTENGRPAEDAEGVRFLCMENGFAVFHVTSGSYNFCSSLV
jgi:alpha-L-rhamnosidase